MSDVTEQTADAGGRRSRGEGRGAAARRASRTGGGGVLCGGIARHLAACGVRVAVLDLKQDAAEACAKCVTDAGGKAVF